MNNPRVLICSNRQGLEKELARVGVDKAGIKIMVSKGVFHLVKLEQLEARAANILKQEMLARGGEAAVSRKVYNLGRNKTDVILMGSQRQFDELCKKLKEQPFSLAKAADEIRQVLENFAKEPPVIRAGQFKLNLAKRTYLMGILNITPDSFSDGGRFFDFDQAIARAKQMVKEGADIIDVGGESTRPGAGKVNLKEEIRRTIPVIKKLAQEINKPISIDTYKSEVARKALKAGATIINDISALRMDKQMAGLVAKTKVPLILMHMQGTPKNMQKNPRYKDVVGEIIQFLRQQAEVAVAAGVKKENIIVDPGIGFGKTVEHNLEIVKRLSEFKSLDYPICLGTSRKSFIGLTLNLPVEERLEGTTATVAVGILNGASIIRAHDVLEMKQVARMVDAIKSVNSEE